MHFLFPTSVALPIASSVLKYPLVAHAGRSHCLKLLSGVLTFAEESPPYGAFSNAPRNAPSGLPPLRICLICPESVWTSDVKTEATEGRREDVVKFAGDSGSRRSMFIVRQFAVAMIDEVFE